LPVEGSITATSKLVAMYDKGKAGVVVTESTVTDNADGNLCSPHACRRSSAARVAGAATAARAVPSTSRRRAFRITPSRTRRRRIRRWSIGSRVTAPAAQRSQVRGDGRLRQADPARPLQLRLHRPGLLHTLCGGDASRFQHIEARFASPVLPGEALTIRMWVTSDTEAVFTTSVRDRLVIDQGLLRHR